LKALSSISDAIGFTSRPVRCDLDELSRLALPAILHWDLDHYVVLAGVSKKHLTILDPARGERVILIDEASKHFTGVALELTPAPSFEKRNSIERVRIGDLWSRLSGFTPILVQLFVLAALLQALGLIAPLSNQLVVDEVIAKGDKALLNAILFGFGAIAIVQIAIELLRGLLQLHAGQLISLQLSGNLLRHLLSLRTEYFERRHIGDVISRFSSLDAVERFMTGGIVSVLLDGVMIIPVAVMMFMYSPKLSALVIANTVIIFAFRAVTFPINRGFTDEQLVLSAKTQSVFLETIRAVRAIKIAGRETERHAFWQNAMTDQLNNAYRQSKFGLWGGAGFSVVQAAQILLMLYIGALQIIDGNMTLGMFFAFQSYSGQFAGRANGLVGAFFTFRMIGLHLERLADIVHADPEATGEPAPHFAKSLQGKIELRDVAFRYSPSDPWIFQNLDLRIDPGERVAIVGPSGGGKTTLLKVLMGLYPPSEGDIRIDGHTLANLGLRGLRERLGVVMQDDQLLSGTIADNVAFFDSHMDMARVEAACRTACVHDEISAKPMGYHSLVGDMGSILSGGQKQRILLARALYKEPAILVMDEGTANLDPDLEVEIMKNLSSLSLTQILVAHRSSVVAAADRVVRIDNGSLSDVTSLGAVAKMMARP
jgi:ATP-binding cassette subfamily B protein RaxB